MLNQLPKAELHIHLEGCITPKTVLQLIRKNKVETEVQTLDQIENLFNYNEYTDFLKAFVFVSNCIQTESDFEVITQEALKNLIAQNVTYVEFIFALPIFVFYKNLDYFKILENIFKAYEKVSEKIKMNLLIDLVRNCGQEMGFKALELVKQSKDFNVVGINLGGDELKFPAKMFEKHFLMAKDFGLKTSCHAGEWGNSESVKDAVNLLKADRIGHGIRSIEDESLIELLVEKEIPLEVCPTSNLKTRIVNSYAEHPIRRLYDEGVKITLNSDDPSFFKTNLQNEIDILFNKVIFSKTELTEILENGFKYSFEN